VQLQAFSVNVAFVQIRDLDLHCTEETLKFNRITVNYGESQDQTNHKY